MILVFGEKGQLASAFAARLHSADAIFLGRDKADLLIPGAAEEAIHKYRPRLVVNCAAFTAVDKAETDRVENHRLNAELVGEIASAARKIDARVLHFSTDYVFSGTGNHAYSENEKKDPVNLYGKAKLEGERLLEASGVSFHCYRISWVFSETGSNFVKTILRLSAEREELKIVNDQMGSPMSARAIAELLLETAVPTLLDGSCKDRVTYNLATLPYVSWYLFAQAVVDEARKLGFGLKLQRLIGIPSAEYRTQALRPLNSRMSDASFRARYGRSLPPWSLSLQECLVALKKEWESNSEG